jgi:cytochrome c peroxidase
VLGWEFNAAGPHSDDPKGNAADRMGSLRRRLAETPESFEGTYRSPSLRNVALTAPYMHTGTLATLEDVIEHYDRGGDAPGTFRGVRSNNVLKLELTAKEKAALLALLRSLTGAP